MLLAQSFTLKGRIVSPPNSSELPPIKILGTIDSTRADEKGAFELNVLAGEQEVQVFLGEKNPMILLIEVRGDTSIEVKPQDLLLSLKAVSINAFRPSLTYDLGKISISIKDIERLPAFLGETDPIKSLSLLPGIQQGVEGSGNLVVRGGGPDQSAILYDGILLYNPYHILGIFSSFSAYSVAGVDVYKGNLPAQFGNRLSAVLNFQAPEPTEKPEGNASLGLLSSSVSYRGKLNGIKDGSYYLSGRTSYLNLISLPLWINYQSPGLSDKTFFNYWLYDLAGGSSFKLNENNGLKLRFFHSRDIFQTREGIINQDEGLFSTSWTNTGVSLKHDWQMGERWALEQQVSQSLYGYRNLGATIEQGVGDSTQLLRDESLGRFGLSNPRYGIQVKGTPKEWLRVNFGTSFQTFQTNFTSSSTFGNANTFVQGANLWAGWAQISLNKGPLSVQAGARASRYGASDSAFLRLRPRLSLSLRLPKDWYFQAGYSVQDQFIQQVSSTQLNLPNETWLLASPELLPANARQFSLGLQSPASNKSLTMQLEAYYKESSGLILFMPSFVDFEFPTQSSNDLFGDGEGRAIGMELLLQGGIGRWKAWLSYTLSRTEQRFQELRNNAWLPALTDRRHILNLVALRKVRTRWEFSFNWVLQSGRPVFIPIGVFEDPFGRSRFVYPDEPSRMPIYHRLDVNWTYHPKPQKASDPTWKFGLYNAYNRLNPLFLEIVRPRQINNNGNIFFTEGRIEGVNILPLLPYFSYSWKF